MHRFPLRPGWRLFITSILLFTALPYTFDGSRFVRAQTANQLITEALFKTLQFRALGPAIMGGRIDDFAVAANNPQLIFVATASGGLWKTSNNGTTWEPLFDHQPVSSIGDV